MDTTVKHKPNRLECEMSAPVEAGMSASCECRYSRSEEGYPSFIWRYVCLSPAVRKQIGIQQEVDGELYEVYVKTDCIKVTTEAGTTISLLGGRVGADGNPPSIRLSEKDLDWCDRCRRPFLGSGCRTKDSDGVYCSEECHAQDEERLVDRDYERLRDRKPEARQ